MLKVANLLSPLHFRHHHATPLLPAGKNFAILKCYMPDYIGLALIGHPVSHSLSPLLHNAALQFAGLKGEYLLIDIEPKNFNHDLQKSLPQNLHGFNITIPYKEDIYALVSKRSAEAELTGAINTVKVEEDKTLSGHNTDLAGFKQSLLESFAFDFKDKNALVIGAGGAARAVIIALCQMGLAKIDIQARDKSKVESFIHRMKGNLALMDATKNLPNISVFDESNKKQIQSLHLVVNASPLGMHNEVMPLWLEQTLELIPKNSICADLVYRKDQSKPSFTQSALDQKLQAIDGLSMLVHQAKSAFAFWTGVNVPSQILFDSLALGEKQSLSS